MRGLRVALVTAGSLGADRFKANVIEPRAAVVPDTREREERGVAAHSKRSREYLWRSNFAKRLECGASAAVFWTLPGRRYRALSMQSSGTSLKWSQKPASALTISARCLGSGDLTRKAFARRE